MSRILMIADDTERWGPARLPEPLREAGLEVAALCAPGNPLNHSSFLSRRYDLKKLKSWRAFGTSLAAAMTDWKPDLIIPCDELVVAMLHYFLKRPGVARRYLSPLQLDVLQRSIGKTEMLDAMMLKHETMALAKSLGVHCPKSEVVDCEQAAIRAASQLGYPVFLKASYSWGGAGVIACKSPQDVAAAYMQLSKEPSVLKKTARRVLARDWYHVQSTVEVQQTVQGESVMYSVAAKDGHILAGLFAKRMSRNGANGPSTVVTLGENADCRQSAEMILTAFCASGFLAFDFMRCATTGHMFLLECNPRPNQICHLGAQVGQDLCKALAQGMAGEKAAPSAGSKTADIPLFPQAWINDEKEALAAPERLDIPRNDPALFRFMLNYGQEKGRSCSSLFQALKHRVAMPQTYTFG
jgi:D-alanine-D-alanine ligase-like ATP-grasp enzyme